MVAKDFEIGDLVWAQMKGYPHWPAKIFDPSGKTKTPAKKNYHFVYFFGTQNYSWILDEKIVHHSEEMLQNVPKKKYSGYQEGVEELLEESRIAPKKPKSPTRITNGETKERISPKLVNKASKRKDGQLLKETVDQSKKVIVKNKSPRKRHSMSEDDVESPPAKKVPSSSTPDKYSTLFANVLPSIGADVNVVPEPDKKKSIKSSLLDHLDDLVHVKASEKKIGFLGMGMMGRAMVKNLIASGHHMTIWNRTPEKCDALVKAGAIKALTPADVVKNSDITFSCLSDPHAVRTVVFGEHGILKGFEKCTRGEKGYVEMSSIDADTSQGIAEAVTDAGMKYLEAPIIGSRNTAESGTVCILGSGDRKLFNECESCFHALSTHAYYISCDVGRSSNINIITSMFLGTMYVALAEALSLTERVQLSQSDIMEILEMRGLSCDCLVDKGKAIIEKNFVPDTALKHQQKDLNLALKLGDSVDQPMTVTTAANEVYKHAKFLGCSDFDAAAVYQGAKY